MAQSLNVACPHCGGHVVDDGSWTGQVVACPYCQEQFQMLSADARTQALGVDAKRGTAKSAAPPTRPGPWRDGRPRRKPWEVTTIGAMRIGSGSLNVLLGMLFFWAVLPLLLIPLGVAEIISGANLLNERPKKQRHDHTIAVFEVVSLLMCGFIQCAIGVLSLVWLSDPKVIAYLDSLEG